jgi:hypothetical protein
MAKLNKRTMMRILTKPIAASGDVLLSVLVESPVMDGLCSRICFACNNRSYRSDYLCGRNRSSRFDC